MAKFRSCTLNDVATIEKTYYIHTNRHNKKSDHFLVKFFLWIFLSHLLIYVQKDFIPALSSFCVIALQNLQRNSKEKGLNGFRLNVLAKIDQTKRQTNIQTKILLEIGNTWRKFGWVEGEEGIDDVFLKTIP